MISYELTDISIGLSLLALFVMNFDRYLATHYPIFHRTSVTKKKLLTLFAFLIIIGTTVRVISINDLLIPYQVGNLIFCIVFIPPMFFIDYKLFTIARKSRRNGEVAAEMKKNFFFEEYIKLLARRRLSYCAMGYSTVGLYCPKTNFQRESVYSR